MPVIRTIEPAEFIADWRPYDLSTIQIHKESEQVAGTVRASKLMLIHFSSGDPIRVIRGKYKARVK